MRSLGVLGQPLQGLPHEFQSFWSVGCRIMTPNAGVFFCRGWMALRLHVVPG